MITTAVKTATSANNRAGTSQFPTQVGLILTSVKTSPGTAKTFSSLAASEVAGGGVAFRGDSTTG